MTVEFVQQIETRFPRESKYDSMFEALRSRPNEWARVATDVDMRSVSQIQAALRYKGFVTRRRKGPMGYDVYGMCPVG